MSRINTKKGYIIYEFFKSEVPFDEETLEEIDREGELSWIADQLLEKPFTDFYDEEITILTELRDSVVDIHKVFDDIEEPWDTPETNFLYCALLLISYPHHDLVFDYFLSLFPAFKDYFHCHQNPNDPIEDGYSKFYTLIVDVYCGAKLPEEFYPRKFWYYPL
jgi:hypothetical protein